MALNLPDTWGVKKDWSSEAIDDNGRRLTDVSRFVFFWGADEYIPRKSVPHLKEGDMIVYTSTQFRDSATKKFKRYKARLNSSGYEERENDYFLRMLEEV